MVKEAGDLLHSVIEFFGILLPGVIFIYLHPMLLHTAFTSGSSTPEPELSIESWVLLFIVSLILGHFLHAFSVPLDYFAIRFHQFKKTTNYLKEAKSSIKLPGDDAAHPSKDYSDMDYFYYVFSFIRIHKPNAVVELERQAADFKFFRSLTFLFLLEIFLSIFDPNIEKDVLLGRIAVSLLTVCLSAIVFKLLFEWTYQLAFELYIQIREQNWESERQLATTK